ncbi:hypothetical protein [Alkalibaculum bacchi]|uniref:hypothetical protein n=1 Tax=Alkalibaculum bacchi TaxID=645887 RepID=UPI0026EF7259|nr:hypothetical protein [Alkalibaculum bacchi]
MNEYLERNEGNNKKIAFVFSCPGAAEEKSNILVSGTTGKNLNKIIQILRQDFSCEHLFDSEDRYDYRITNASMKVHYKAKDGRSEPTKKEITDSENLRRLTEDLECYEFIITFGNNANFAVNHCKDKLVNQKIINVRHLGLQSLNQIKVDVDGEDISNPNNDKDTGNANTLKRLKVVAKEIGNQLV